MIHAEFGVQLLAKIKKNCIPRNMQEKTKQKALSNCIKFFFLKLERCTKVLQFNIDNDD